MSLLRVAAERICFSRDHAHYRTKLLIELSRAALMQTLHERSVDKRRTLIQRRVRRVKSLKEDFLIFLWRPLWSIYVLGT